MKRYFTLVLLCLLSCASFACSCIDIDNFCDGVGETAIIVLVKVKDIDAIAGTATLERIELLQGDIPESFDINLYSPCPNSSGLLVEDGEALVNLTLWGEAYSLAPCVLGVLPLKNGKLQGKVTSNESNMSYSQFKEKEFDCFDETKLLDIDDITIFPNPFFQSIFYTNDFAEIEAIELYNIKGQLLYKERPIASLTGHIDAPNFPMGIYLLKITASGKDLTYKVVKGQ